MGCPFHLASVGLETLMGIDPWSRIIPPPAAFMVNGLCSDCGIEPIICADGDMKACPKCFSVLWHRDYAAIQRQAVLQRREFERVRIEELRKAKAEMKARARIKVAEFDGRDHRY